MGSLAASSADGPSGPPWPSPGRGLAGALGARAAWAQAAKSSGEVVVCTWGGSYTESQKKAFFDPFEQETGIRVRVVGIPDLAKIQAMVQSHAVEWDLVRRRRPDDAAPRPARTCSSAPTSRSFPRDLHA